MDLKAKIRNTVITDDQLALFYLGQVGFALKYRGKTILIDPYLTDYVDRHCCSELVTWKRRYPSPMTPEDADFADFVFCTHAHYDHADPDTLKVIADCGSAVFFVPSPIRDTLIGYGIPADRVVGLGTDVPVEFAAGMKVTALPAAHEEIHRAADGNCLECGYRFDLGGITLYHSGDCCPYDGLEDRLKDTDIEIMPVNGRDYYRTRVMDIIGCFDSCEAATIAKNTGASLLIPVHFDLYDVNSLNPAVFVDTLQTKAPGLPFHIFAPGERYIFQK